MPRPLPLWFLSWSVSTPKQERGGPVALNERRKSGTDFSRGWGVALFYKGLFLLLGRVLNYLILSVNFIKCPKFHGKM